MRSSRNHTGRKPSRQEPTVISMPFKPIPERWAGLDDLPDEPEVVVSDQHPSTLPSETKRTKPANTAPKSLKSLNSHPVNKAAAKWLRQANSPPDENWLYLLQLLWWGLNESNLKWRTPQAQELREKLDSAVNALLGRTDHQHVWNYLVHGAEGELRAALTPETLHNAQDPKDAAWRALDALNMVMSADPNVSRDYLDE